ncbi:MAG: twin-arginine translocation pathway signal protein [Polyangiales bacterium]
MADRHDDPNLPPAADAGAPSTGKTSRRTFIGVTASGIAVGGAIATGVSRVRADGRDHDHTADDGRSPIDRARDERQRKRQLDVRVEAARTDYEAPVAPHPTNGDEERYENKIGTDTRGLPHDQRGEVDLAAWALAKKAYDSGEPADFERIPLGGTRKQVNPLGTLAANLTGVNPVQIALPPAPALASAQKASEAVELYWQAILRDVPFHEYPNHPDAHAAAEELSKLEGYTGPKVNGKVTPELLFRGSVTYVDARDKSARTPKHVVPPGVLEGPYISQFLLRDIPQGVATTSSNYRLPTAARENDFNTTYAEWLATQNGAAPTRKTVFDAAPRHVNTGRDLAEYVHGGSPAFWGASIILGSAAGTDKTQPAGLGAPLSPTNYYLKSKTQASGAGSGALAWLQGLLVLGQSYAIRAEYWQKWFVHRHLRAEAYGGLVHNKIAEGADYPLHADVLDSKAVARSFSKHGSYLLPQAFPEGAPIHSAYPGGNASISSVSVTLLKSFFDESYVIPDPVQLDPKDPSKLIPYVGPPLTVGGELNKLAINSSFGRNWAGIHWRTDAAAAFAAGEAVAISLLRNEKKALIEPFGGFTLTKFDGEKILI